MLKLIESKKRVPVDFGVGDLSSLELLTMLRALIVALAAFTASAFMPTSQRLSVGSAVVRHAHHPNPKGAKWAAKKRPKKVTDVYIVNCKHIKMTFRLTSQHRLSDINRKPTSYTPWPEAPPEYTVVSDEEFAALEAKWGPPAEVIKSPKRLEIDIMAHEKK